MEDNQNYLYYDDEQIPELEVKRKLANDVDLFVANLPWSSKKKQRFMSAYSDIMSKGIKGVSINNGFYTTSVNGDIDLNSLSDKDRDAYELVSGFIQREMKSLKKSSKKTEEKKDLKVLTNSDFVSGLHDFISRDRFGGRDWHIGGEQDLWNLLDERNDKGIRSTNKRAEVLADALQRYSDTIDETKYNFEGSPFNDYSDFKTRVNTAINSLRDNKWDLNDIDALNRIGLNYKDYFNDGSGDSFKKDDYEGTYGDYYNNYLPNKLQAEQKQKNEKFSLYLQQIRNTPRPLYRIMKTQLKNRNLPTIRLLADKYGSTDNLLNLIIEYGNKGLDNLTSEETNELIAAFKNGATKNISKDEHNILKSFPSLKNSSIGRFKKFAQIDNLILDTSTGQVINIYDLTTADSRLKDFLSGKSSKELEQQYLNSKIPGLTNAEWLELVSIGLDIGSIVDPEPFTAAGLGIGAAALRHNAKNNTPGHKWGFWETVGQGIDYTTGAIAALPVLGDLGLAAKLAIKGDKYLPLISKALRLVGRAGAWKDVAEGGTGTVQALSDKISKGEEFTVEDWRNVATLIRGLAGHGLLSRSNISARRVLEKRGVQINKPSDVKGLRNKARAYTDKIGLTSTKAKPTETKPTIKVKDESGKDVDLEITPLKKLQLEEKFKGKSKSEKEAIIKGDSDIKSAAQSKGVDIEKVTINPLKSLRNIKVVRNHIGTNKGIFGTTSPSATPRTNDTFDTYLKNRNLWDRLRYGSDGSLLRIDNNMMRNGIYGPLTNNIENTSSNQVVTPKTKRGKPLSKAESKELQSTLRGKNFSSNKITGDNAEEIKGFADIYGFKNNDGTNTLEFELKDGTKISFKETDANIKNKTLETLRKDVMKKIDKVVPKADRVRIKSEVVKQLKLWGYLKEGGTINRLKIQQYKEFIKR